VEENSTSLRRRAVKNKKRRGQKKKKKKKKQRRRPGRSLRRGARGKRVMEEVNGLWNTTAIKSRE